ncbi:MAG: mechanosensitive ion channel family protein [Pseudomonadota bacterium]
MEDEVINTLGDWIGNDNWMILSFAILLLSLLFDFIQRQILARIERRAKETENLWDDAFINALIRPISLLIWLFGITMAAEVAFRQGDRSVLPYIDIVLQIGLVLSITWFLIRLIEGVEKALIVRADADDEDALDRTTVDALGKLVRISIIITAILVVLQNLGISISGVLAFGGIGGLAVGLAAKDILANFFGGLTVYLDRPFKVGDWICSPDRSIEGVVEHIGWRQTTIRKFDKRPLYVPNSTFTTIAVENPSRMTNRRIYETIGIRYDDIAQMDAITVAVKSMLENHPEIDQNQALIVNFNAFAPSSLDFFIYTLTKTTDWFKYHEIKQDVLLQIEGIIADHGAEIAFPTSTVHLGSTPPQLAGIEREQEREA